MHQGGTRGARSAPFWSVYVVDKEGKPGSQRATPKNGWALRAQWAKKLFFRTFCHILALNRDKTTVEGF